MIGQPEPHLMTGAGGGRFTVLDCQLGGHSGVFTITRTVVNGKRKWGCDACLAKHLGSATA